jgi:ankyrin repeat protein
MNSIDEELLEAAQENNLPEVERLLSVRADVNAKGSGGWTPLHGASSEGHVQVVKKLVEHRVDLEAKDNEGDTPYTSPASTAMWPL